MSDRRQVTLLLGMVAFLLAWFLLWHGGFHLMGTMQAARMASGAPPYDLTAPLLLLVALGPATMAVVAVLFAVVAAWIVWVKR